MKHLKNSKKGGNMRSKDMERRVISLILFLAVIVTSISFPGKKAEASSTVNALLEAYADQFTYLGQSNQTYHGYIEMIKNPYYDSKYPKYSCEGSFPIEPISYRIDDYDQDGQDELLIVTMDQSFRLKLEMYEAEDNEVLLKDSSLFVSYEYDYPEHTVEYVEAGVYWEKDEMSCFTYDYQGTKIIAIEKYHSAYIGANGDGYNFVMVSYDGNQLSIVNESHAYGSLFTEEDINYANKEFENMGIILDSSKIFYGTEKISDYIDNKIVFAGAKTRSKENAWDIIHDSTEDKIENMSDITFTMQNTGHTGGETAALSGSDQISSFTLNKAVRVDVDREVPVDGFLELSGEKTVSSDLFSSLVSAVTWESSDPSVAEVTKCSAEYASDGLSADLSVIVKTKKEGTATITGTAPNGMTAECKMIAAKFDREIYHAAYLYDFYKDNSGGMQGFFYSDTPAQIMHNQAETSGLATSVEAWNTMQDILGAVDDPSKILDKPMEKTQLYEGIIFALFEDAAVNDKFLKSSTDILKQANSFASSIVNLAKSLYAIPIAEDNDIAGLSIEQKERLSEVTEAFFKDNKIVKSADRLSKIVNYVDYFNNFLDYIKYVCNCIAIVNMSDAYKAVLQDMYDDCWSLGDGDLGLALMSCKDMMHSNELEMIEKIAYRTEYFIGKEAIKFEIKAYWDGLKTQLAASNPYAALLWGSYKASTFICDSVFNTSAIAEKTVKLEAMTKVRALVLKAYEKEKGMFAGAETKINAENYLAAVNIGFRYLDEDCKTASAFIDTVSDALATKIANALLGNNGKIDAVKKQVSSMQQYYADGYQSTQTSWITGGLLGGDYPGEYENYAYLLNDNEDQAKKKYTVACPVDVCIYDAAGNVAASIIGSQLFCKDDLLTVGIDGNEKEVWFYEGAEKYTIHYIGTDTGMMDIIVEEYNGEGDAVRKVQHMDIPLEKGLEYTSEDDLKLENQEYHLRQSERTIEPVIDTDKKDLPKYTLTIYNGYMAGETVQGYKGSFYAGEKVTVYSNIPEKANFTGWKSDVVNGSFTNQDARITTFTMPAHNTNLTASYDQTILIEGIQLKADDALKVNEKLQLNATVSPENASNKTLKWSSSDESVAVVDQNGLLTAVGMGEVTITVESTDGSNISVPCKLIVAKGMLPNTDPTVSTNPSTTSDPAAPTGPADSSTASDSTVDPVASDPTEPSSPKDDDLVIKLLYYIVVFDANSGTKLSRKTMTLLNDDNLGILPKTERKNYIFSGWYTQKDGGEKVSSSTVLNAATTLYARWESAKPGKVSGLALKSKKSRQLKVSFKKKAGADGYEVAYSKKKNFPASSTKKSAVSAAKKTLKKLKAGQKYYVKVRAYRIDSTGSKAYGTYSKVKSIKVK